MFTFITAQLMWATCPNKFVLASYLSHCRKLPLLELSTSAMLPQDLHVNLCHITRSTAAYSVWHKLGRYLLILSVSYSLCSSPLGTRPWSGGLCWDSFECNGSQCEHNWA